MNFYDIPYNVYSNLYKNNPLIISTVSTRGRYKVEGSDFYLLEDMLEPAPFDMYKELKGLL